MEIHCEYFSESGYSCVVRKVVKNSSASGAIVFKGDHRPGKLNYDVRRVDIENQPLDAFPRYLHEKFPNLTQLWIPGCGIKKISKADLIGLENLDFIHLDENKLTSLPDNLLCGMKNLRSIFCNHNKLERLSSKLLKPVETTLQFALFEKNTKIDDRYSKFEGNKSLKRLMDVLDALEPPLPETEPQTEPTKTFNHQQEHHQQLTAKLSGFKDRGEFNDLTIKVGEKEFKVHKAILAALSSVFRQNFLNGDEITEKPFTKVKKLNEESFGSFLDFFYTGKVDDNVNALEVFELAIVFEVSILKEICFEKILTILSEANALDAFNIGSVYGFNQLKLAAFKFIQKILPEMPEKTKNFPDQVNKLIKAKQELDSMLEESKDYESQS